MAGEVREVVSRLEDLSARVATSKQAEALLDAVKAQGRGADEDRTTTNASLKAFRTELQNAKEELLEAFRKEVKKLRDELEEREKKFADKSSEGGDEPPRWVKDLLGEGKGALAAFFGDEDTLKAARTWFKDKLVKGGKKALTAATGGGDE